MTYTTITLRGSWGDLTVHRETGHVVEYDDHGQRGWSADDVGYHDIALIDPRTLIDPALDRFGEADILSAGWWTKDGRYATPMTWVEDAGVDKYGETYGDWFELPLLPPPPPRLFTLAAYTERTLYEVVARTEDEARRILWEADDDSEYRIGSHGDTLDGPESFEVSDIEEIAA